MATTLTVLLPMRCPERSFSFLTPAILACGVSSKTLVIGNLPFVVYAIWSSIFVWSNCTIHMCKTTLCYVLIFYGLLSKTLIIKAIIYFPFNIYNYHGLVSFVFLRPNCLCLLINLNGTASIKLYNI
ncbi:hypothetical protein XENTR_v10024336 [Xenopus tropicalis]|nr:hypothetical protein XENTR_v10024336 [Xenopus tropicalis]